ncbi:hypothetical protein [Flavobacterium sp. NG2]
MAKALKKQAVQVVLFG